MTQERPDRRARTVALVGLVFSLVATGYFVVLQAWSQASSVHALAVMSAVGSLVWLFLTLVYHQRVLVQDEFFETEQLKLERQQGTAAIFDAADEHLLLARRRLRWMYKWMLPAFTVLYIIMMMVAGGSGWTFSLTESVLTEAGRKAFVDIQQANRVMYFVGGAAFVSFLLSRYAAGMARQPEWRMLRAGASYLMGLTLAAAATSAALGLVALRVFETSDLEHVLAYALRVLLFVLAVETLLNFILDFYRPRGADEEPRPAFESRLLGLFSEPGGIARSIAEALNYQFGFEVSSTWFYKLLQRSVVPLVSFAAATLLAASCLVFVNADERAIVERFGRKYGQLEPGLHFKLPWPIDVSYAVSTEQVHELRIGLEPEGEKANDREKLILWTNKHPDEPHLLVLVATPELTPFLGTGLGGPGAGSQPAGERGAAPKKERLSAVSAEPTTRPIERGFSAGGEAVPVSMLRVAVSIQYRIHDAWDWLTTYNEPEKVFEAIATQETTRYCAGVAVGGLLGGQRESIEAELSRRIQQAAKNASLGVNIVYLGLQGVHPPESTAQAFQNVIGAEQIRLATISVAEADKRKRLTEVAGDETRAVELQAAIQDLSRVEGDANASSSDRQAAYDRMRSLFFGDAATGRSQVGGEAASKISQARAKRWELENGSHARAVAFEQEMATSKAAPAYYRLRKFLEARVAAAAEARKYIITAQARIQTYYLNLQDPMNAPLDITLDEKK